MAGLVVPGQVGAAGHATAFAEDLEAFLEVAANRHDQIQMAYAPIGELHRYEPARTVEFRDVARLNLHDLAAEEARGVDQVTAVGEHVIAPAVGLGVASRPA